MRKKRLIVSIIIILLLLFIGVFLYPLSFEDVILDTADLSVVHIETSVANGMPKQESSDYCFAPDSEEGDQIRCIIQKYSCHRSLRSFFNVSSLDGNDAGYWLFLYSGGNDIICGGTNDIMVNGHVYRIGYWGNHKALSMMDEIRSVLISGETDRK